MLEGIVSNNRRNAIIRDYKRRVLQRLWQGRTVEFETMTGNCLQGSVQMVVYSPYGDDGFYAYVVAGNPDVPTAATYVRLG